jgi:sulfoxide reductase heme-binding subunit YedZ
MNGDKIFAWSVAHRTFLIRLLYAYSVVAVLLTIVAAYFTYIGHSLSLFFYELSKTAGTVGIGWYTATLLPGIFRRMRLKFKLVSILMIYRRYIGIAMFCTIVYHYSILRGVHILASGKIEAVALAEVFGMGAFFIFLFMAVTSNDASVKKLGIWWSKIHSLTHLALWLVFFHVASQGFSMTTVFLGILGIIQIFSFIYIYRKVHSF